MLFIYPAMFIKTAWKDFSKYMNKNDAWWHIPEVLLAFFVVVAIILLLNGYR
jgi:hypothetical protein